MRSDELVRSLVADLTPVRRLRGVDTRVVAWGSLAVACVLLAAYALGLRRDLVGKLHDPGYLAESAALLVVFGSCARAAFGLAIPGAEPDKLARIVPVVALLAWILLVAHRWSPATSAALRGAVSWTSGSRCVARMLGLGVAPIGPMFIMLRAAAPRARAWTGCLAVLSVSAVAMLGTQMICAKDDAGHVLLWHVAPLLVAAVVGLGAGAVWLARSRDRSPLPAR